MTRLLAAALLLVATAACRDATAAPTRRSDDADRVVHVTVRHSRFSPSTFTFPAGTRVRFVIRNSDPIEHEFLLGDQGSQDAHERGTEAAHGDRDGEVTVPAGGVAETSFTFERRGPMLLGCHVPGHWDYGMRGLVTVTTR